MESGPLLHLKYAFPCVEDKLRAGRISQEDFERMEFCIKFCEEPEIPMLERCFPNATGALHNDWSFENVSGYWRNRHGHEGSCAVRKVTVWDFSEIDGEKVVSVYLNATLRFFVLNTYRLPLDTGDEVFIHKWTIVEKVEK